MALAQINIARLVADVSSPRVKDFMDNLDRVNAIAERSDGFIWRLKDDGGNATTLTIDQDPRLIPNLSLWRDWHSLRAFAFQTVHRRFVERRADWFEDLERPYFCMWILPEGQIPTLEDGLERLKSLEIHGESQQAFTWISAQNGLFV